MLQQHQHNIVDGSEIRQENQLRLVVYLPLFTVFFFTSQVVIAGFLNHQQYPYVIKAIDLVIKAIDLGIGIARIHADL